MLDAIKIYYKSTEDQQAKHNILWSVQSILTFFSTAPAKQQSCVHKLYIIKHV